MPSKKYFIAVALATGFDRKVAPHIRLDYVTIIHLIHWHGDIVTPTINEAPIRAAIGGQQPRT